ncbi:MAG TPA: hypothetical protein DCQ51_11725 [Planktothrix sp. UBA8407]|jgi:hypothetical protein|nr:hypothetical protein [Planktothrix sp. UBA8407]HBK21167.1 hypothetical protein [Planktothrix sp. UBA10369]
MIEHFDAMAVASLVQAINIANLDIPSLLATKINQVAQTLKEDLDLGKSDYFYSLIDELEENYSNIYELYLEEYSKIQEPDHSQERSKGITPDEEPEEQPLYLRNFCANCEFLKTFAPNKTDKNPEPLDNTDQSSDSDKDPFTPIIPLY